MVGFPHSEIPGSKLIRSSPRLIAAYYVLHRLCTPRHPLDALKTLDRSHYQCPQHHQRPNPLAIGTPPSSVIFVRCFSTPVLIGQIKLTRFHVALLILPGVRVKRFRKPSLYNVERSANPTHDGTGSANFALVSHAVYRIIVRRRLRYGATTFVSEWLAKPKLHEQRRLVEPDGIEPTTSCLQSRRSPS